MNVRNGLRVAASSLGVGVIMSISGCGKPFPQQEALDACTSNGITSEFLATRANDIEHGFVDSEASVVATKVNGSHIKVTPLKLNECADVLDAKQDHRDLSDNPLVQSVKVAGVVVGSLSGAVVLGKYFTP